MSYDTARTSRLEAVAIHPPPRTTVNRRSSGWRWNPAQDSVAWGNTECPLGSVVATAAAAGLSTGIPSFGLESAADGLALSILYAAARRAR